MKYRILPLLMFMFMPMLLAQSERGTIAGSVIDASSAAVPGARIFVTNMATNVTAITATTEAGVYTAANLPAGTYSVRVEKNGFKPAVRSGITLNASANTRLDISLEVGPSQQTVEVVADVQQMQTESARNSATVTNKLVDELPLVVGGALRSPFDLAQLTPEVKNLGTQSFVVGGGQAASFGITLDGVSAANTRALDTAVIAVNSPSLEAITEFTVEWGGFKAESGHAAGGVLTFSSKSGTNTLHGSAYEFLRNDALDTRRFFEARRGVYKQHDFGLSLGGPIYLPSIYNGKNRSFVFASYEGFRNRVGAATVARSVPTAEMYEGDFSRWVNAARTLIPIYDPDNLTTNAAGRSRLQFPGNRIPKARFDPLAARLIATYGSLAPNNGAAPGSSEYVRSNYLVTHGTTITPIDKLSVKGDHMIGGNDRISAYFGWNRSDKDAGPGGFPSLPGFFTDMTFTRNTSDVARVSWDHVIGTRLMNHFFAGFNRYLNAVASPNQDGHWKDKFCFPNVPDCDRNLFNVSFSEFSSWGGSNNAGSENNILALHDDLTWIRGKHTFKTGGMYQRSDYNGFADGNPGLASFSYTGTGVPGDTNFTTAGGNSFASFLLGRVDSALISTDRFIGQQWSYFAGYFQDDYRVNQRLTLNLGIRWETTLPPVEQQDRFSDFSPVLPNPAAGGIPGALIFAGTGQGREGSRSLADSYFGAWGPHFGLAFRPAGKTVIRAAYARSFGAVTTVTGTTHQRGFVQGLPFRTLNQGIDAAFRFQDGMPPWPKPPFIDPSFSNGDSMPWWQGSEATRPPETNTWTVSIQRQVTQSLLVEATYSGLVGSHLQTALLNYNQVDPSLLVRYGTTLLQSNIDSTQAAAAGIGKPYPSFTGTVAQALRPFPQYQAIDTGSGGGDHSGHSSYHAAVLRAEKRYSHGLVFQGSYVFSKILTDSDTYWGPNLPLAEDQYNRKLDKSIGGFDLTHNFKLGLIYELPFARRNKWLGGWRVSTTHYYSSGAPIFLITTISLPLFAGRQTPTIATYDGWRGATAHDSFDPQTDRFFQPASFFGPQPSNRFGNMTRFNPKLREFPNYNENVSLAKSFPIRDRLRLDFRGEAFNLLNRVRFGTGSRVLQDNNLGRLISNSDLLNDPRRMQVAAKLSW